MTGVVRETSLSGDEAVFSPCGLYRYLLTRGQGSPCLGVVMCNPSTADAFKNDPTITRVCGFAQRWGYPRILIGNVFAFRSTDPKGLRAVDDPVGPLNQEYLELIVWTSDRVLVAWGAHNGATIQARFIVEYAKGLGKELLALRETQAGHPYHPLYVHSTTEPKGWPSP